MNNSQPQIQQGSNNSTQIGFIDSVNSKLLKEFVKNFKKHLDELKLDIEDRSDAQAEIATIESQLNSRKPKQVIITECLKSLKLFWKVL